MVDRPRTVLDDMADRIVEIAPAMAEVKSADDVTVRTISDLAYALGVVPYFRLFKPESD